MRDYLSFETAPYRENCVQVRRDRIYYPMMKLEAQLMKHQLIQEFPELEDRLVIARCSHDFGTYLELRAYYEANTDYSDEDEELNTEDVVFELENNFPEHWNVAYYIPNFDTSIITDYYRLTTKNLPTRANAIFKWDIHNKYIVLISEDLNHGVKQMLDKMDIQMILNYLNKQGFDWKMIDLKELEE